MIEQSMITSTGKLLELARPLQVSKPVLSPLGDTGEGVFQTLDELERDHILKALRLTAGRVRGTGGAAEILGIMPNTLDGRMRKLGIKKEHVVLKPGTGG